jgi:uncharacterized coiled-coil protein SlyX
MATIEELEERISKLEETILVQGDILKRILEILKQRTDKGVE